MKKFTLFLIITSISSLVQSCDGPIADLNQFAPKPTFIPELPFYTRIENEATNLRSLADLVRFASKSPEHKTAALHSKFYKTIDWQEKTR